MEKVPTIRVETLIAASPERCFVTERACALKEVAEQLAPAA
jgi:hypothetical protein